jgi:hypothetical protein
MLDSGGDKQGDQIILKKIAQFFWKVAKTAAKPNNPKFKQLP